MKIKKGDIVLIISGKDKGRTAKVLKSLPKEGRIFVEGINLKKKHSKPKKQGEKGQVINIPGSIEVSNVKLVCPKCGKAARIGYIIEKDSLKNSKKQNKFRICKKCKSKV
ncbi:MAG: Ribosomal protein L24 [Parcubacteria group bacterium GW2011_GWA1_33_6]|uniref:Large ribosomal subunit protein uL24 n=1 Tax=Candidatus Staskawiczbacteria bacterium RIFCSPHIGHO2_02_FULL_33_16 TaxID=1802204 RepID=A0A1G2HVR5_9BACT|nr:MAG: Ribosomal protein L24 [Parcubacteria group bacterium GW2011_GWA2_33_14]KKP54224.1 MAG: Ribosomal protein L24 [Parcubacteria group bacterium GW2011_GWA1_33_6]OGZ65938.1 MAG: 50S ribosomal protein L24 [Candidatus Staskawiczbacteria bacterium RIFCSPHIGHO2_02_FULL_33_16]OGZ70564.1 MAG: 50S ribosomal protein L24 [Candidatus Staskawiczbacteria bacterium RIFCSPLOWO2_01_FULL_33_13]